MMMEETEKNFIFWFVYLYPSFLVSEFTFTWFDGDLLGTLASYLWWWKIIETWNLILLTGKACIKKVLLSNCLQELMELHQVNFSYILWVNHPWTSGVIAFGLPSVTQRCAFGFPSVTQRSFTRIPFSCPSLCFLSYWHTDVKQETSLIFYFG